MALEQYVAAVLAGECSTFRSDEGVKAMAVDTLDCVNLAKAGVERSKLVFELVILAMMISSGKPAVTISITESLVRISWPTTTPMSSKAAITKNTNRLFSISALLNRKTSSHPL